MLYWQQFEELVRALGLRLFGASLTSFKPGRDGGRDARFEGLPNCWPSLNGQERGKYVLQSKHTLNANGCCSDEDFAKQMRVEVKKVKTLIASDELSHYLVFTNRKKSAAEDESFRKTFKKLKGLSNAWLVGSEHLHDLLAEHGDIWDRFEEDARPLPRFNRDDLIRVIRDFASFVHEQNGRVRTNSLKHLKLQEKNKLNLISSQYFADLQRHSMPQFEQIRFFLENPRNERYLDLYRDAADDLRGRLRAMVSTEGVGDLEQALEQVRTEFISTDAKLVGKKRWVRVFLDYMYCTCDIGKNVDAS